MDKEKASHSNRHDVILLKSGTKSGKTKKDSLVIQTNRKTKISR